MISRFHSSFLSYLLGAVVLFLQHQPAGAWEKNYTVSHQMSEAESVMQARELAVEKIRTKALADVGHYIFAKSSIQNDAYKESIELISATIMSITNITDTVEIEEDQLKLNLSARVTVDEKETETRINQYLRTYDLKQEIDELAHQNYRLRETLSDILKNKLTLSEVVEAEQILQKKSDILKAADTIILSESSIQLNLEGLEQISKTNIHHIDSAIKSFENRLYKEILNPRVHVNILSVAAFFGKQQA